VALMKMLVRAVIVSVVAGLALAALLISLAPTVVPVIDSIPQPARSIAPITPPMMLEHIAERILRLPVRI
jgi:hypothetical protein